MYYPKQSGNEQGSSNILIQPQLEIGESDDAYEQEADAVTDKVISMPENPAQSKMHVSAITQFFSTEVTPDLDFAYACGGATLYPVGNFSLTRTKNIVDVTGTIEHVFKDIYDWEIGLDVTLAGPRPLIRK